MGKDQSPTIQNLCEQIAGLVQTLQAAQQELQTLPGGQSDSIGNISRKMLELRDGLGKLRDTGTAMQAFAEKQTQIFNALPAHTAVLDADGTIQMVNQSWEHFASLNAMGIPGLLVGQNYIAACENATGSRSEEARAVATGIRQVMHHELETFFFEYPCHSSKEKRWFRLLVTPLSGASGTGTVVVHANVTERRLAEETTRQLSQAVQQSPVSIIITDRHGRIEYVNPQFTKVTGYTAGEVKGQNPRLLKGGETSQQTYKELWRTILTGGTWRGELHNRKKNGELFWELSSISPVMDAEGGISHFLAVKEDITERKRIQDQVAQALREKEVLLKEIHHRVKNNLQVICSLLAMQSDSTTEKFSHHLLMEAQNRVRSMAMIHEKLYLSDDLARVDFGEYVNSLSAFLFRCYSNAADRVQLNVSAEDVRLNIDTASPCGLLLNELISNALKHAFPDGRSGELRVELCHEPEGYSLTVADNGVGLPAGFEFKQAGSMGLQLIEMLTQQIKGKLTIQRERGTSFRLEFKEIIYVPRG